MELADAKERHHPGCPTLCCYWFQNLFAMFEFFGRVAWHVILVGFWAMLYLCNKENPTVLANMGYHGMALSAYFASFGVISHNLAHPTKPAYTFGGYTSLDRPVPPLASGEHALLDGQKPEESVENGEDVIHPLGLLQNICFVCSAKHPLQHLERFMKSLFCSFSCCHACHASLCCGPCCMGCRGCYNTMPQRIMTWNAKIQAKRDPKILAFYQKTFKVWKQRDNEQVTN